MICTADHQEMSNENTRYPLETRHSSTSREYVNHYGSLGNSRQISSAYSMVCTLINLCQSSGNIFNELCLSENQSQSVSMLSCTAQPDVGLGLLGPDETCYDHMIFETAENNTLIHLREIPIRPRSKVHVHPVN